MSRPAARVVPVLLLRGGSGDLVKGHEFAADRPVGAARPALALWATRDVDELVLLDVTAAREGRLVAPALVSYLAGELRAPLAVGGGVRTPADAKRLLDAGADRVVVGGTRPKDVDAIALRVGSANVAATVDHRGDLATTLAVALAAESAGAGELLLQDVLRDGTLAGVDPEPVRALAAQARVPVVAGGGAASYSDLGRLLAAGASGAAAGALWQFRAATPRGARAWLAAHGFHVRPEIFPQSAPASVQQ